MRINRLLMGYNKPKYYEVEKNTKTKYRNINEKIQNPSDQTISTQINNKQTHLLQIH